MLPASGLCQNWKRCCARLLRSMQRCAIWNRSNMPEQETSARIARQTLNGEDDPVVIGRRVVRIEAAAIADLEQRIDDAFARAVDMIFQCRGRVVVTGIGKSGIVGKKIAATLSSTGTPAIFLHSAEGLHGDLGVVLKEDLVICISKSGNSSEMKVLTPLFRRLGVPVIAMTTPGSQLAANADIVLDISVAEEACPLDLAPTASSTATLVMGDALAVALLARRNFSAEDFALRHPGGTLGKRLLLRIDDLMGEGEKIPMVAQQATLREVILEITSKRYGATCVVDEDGVLLGIITDGDLRRLFSTPDEIRNFSATEMMTADPKTVTRGTLAVNALE
ncbi:MAG TPA: KpsF/GutQ family sugar-phosphate isomerase, partial [Bacteroidetes bacterium]|nr:KpsF/GutQ family sugar-phosphate isomerase [Bacteroidota bacterium]